MQSWNSPSSYFCMHSDVVPLNDLGEMYASLPQQEQEVFAGVLHTRNLEPVKDVDMSNSNNEHNPVQTLVGVAVAAWGLATSSSSFVFGFLKCVAVLIKWTIDCCNSGLTWYENLDQKKWQNNGERLTIATSCIHGRTYIVPNGIHFNTTYNKMLEKRTKAQDYKVEAQRWIVALRGLHPIALQMSWMRLSTDGRRLPTP